MIEITRSILIILGLCLLKGMIDSQSEINSRTPQANEMSNKKATEESYKITKKILGLNPGKAPQVNVSINIPYISGKRITCWASIKVFTEYTAAIPLPFLKEDHFQVHEKTTSGLEPARNIRIKPVRSLERPLDVYLLIVLDRSESMNFNLLGINEVYPKIKSAIESTKTLLQKLAQLKQVNLKLGLLPFSNSPSQFITFNTDIWTQDIGKVEQALAQIEPTPKDSLTELWRAMNIAYDSLKEKKGMKIMITLTDGKDENHEKEPGISGKWRQRLATKCSSREVNIFNFAFKREKNEGISELTDISERAGTGGRNAGTFIDVNPQELPELLKNISNGIQDTYEITWDSWASEPGSKVEAKVTIKVLDQEIIKTFTYTIGKNKNHPYRPDTQ